MSIKSESSVRMTAIAAGSWADGKLEAQTVKTEHMPVVLKDLLDAGYAVSEEDITNAEFKPGSSLQAHVHHQAWALCSHRPMVWRS
jgi:hypothetical protein